MVDVETVENTISVIETFDIGEAVRRMRAGDKVARVGWNGKGMWLAIVEGKQIDARTGPQLFAPYVMMKTAHGVFVPWLCSQSDLLAFDWCVVGKGESSPFVMLVAVEDSDTRGIFAQ